MIVPSAISPKLLIPQSETKVLKGGQSLESGESEESEVVKVACMPCMPTQEEVEIHNATHFPFRSWCKFCVAGKAKANPHWKKDDSRAQGEHVVSLDYAFLGDKSEPRKATLMMKPRM